MFNLNITTKALEHLSTFASKADLNLCLPTNLLSLLSTKSVTEEFLVEEFQAFFICDGNETASECKKQGAGDNSFPPQPLPLPFLCCSPLPTSPHFFCSPQTRLFARSCSISPPAKWKGNVCYACRMPQSSRSLQSNHVLCPIKISACSRTKIAEERTSYKRQPVTDLFRCD